MNSLQTQLRKNPPPVAAMPWKFGNPFSNNQSGRKYFSRDKNDVLDTVSGAWFYKSIDFQTTARSIQIIVGLLNTIKTNIPQSEQECV